LLISLYVDSQEIKLHYPILFN